MHERSVLAHNKGAPEGSSPPETQEAGIRASALAHLDAQPWDSAMPFMRLLEKAGIDRAYPVYLELGRQNAGDLAFYLHCVAWFRRKGRPDLSLRILSNIYEQDMVNRQTLRMLAYRCERLGRYDHRKSDDLHELRPPGRREP